MPTHKQTNSSKKSSDSQTRPAYTYKQKFKRFSRDFLKVLVAIGVFVGGGLLLWAATFEIPDLESFRHRQIPQSTKIYDRTGEIVLYDLGKDFQRTIIPLDEMGQNIKDATIAIEDEEFYEHSGVDPSAIVRAIYTNVKNGNLLGGQGGSTITQQVVKNTLLTPEKTVSRKVKEWFLAVRLEQEFNKDEILALYLNEVPYGGTLYGIYEASHAYFGKDPADLSIAEAAYLAALPKAPTYYSPSGSHTDELEMRKNTVLRSMENNGFISEDELAEATDEEVSFIDPSDRGIKAPHFVFYIIEQLEEEYGSEYVQRGGLNVITTLDWELQQKAQEIVTEEARSNAEVHNANNGSMVALNPKNGEVLVMVGSRDYHNEEIDGAVNIATALNQPGSAFKPFVYATAFNEGYTDRTVLFNLRTQFSTACSPANLTTGGDCYAPINYNYEYTGPMTLRNALAQSVNVPAVKLLYLVGADDAVDTAERMGISTLDQNADRYGLSLVLGAGEVTLLDMVSSYGVFATEGVQNPKNSILRVETGAGEVLLDRTDEEGPTNGNQMMSQRVLPSDTARMINNILSDNTARTPAFGPNSPLYFPNHDVAAKTGTTNDYQDAWIIGYTPNLVVGAWAGNNNNESMRDEVSAYIVAPMWNQFMQIALNEYSDTFPNEKFSPMPEIDYNEIKPVLAGHWQGSLVRYRDSDEQSDEERIIEEVRGVPVRSDEPRRGQPIIYGGVHSILHWVDKDDPTGPVPTNPASDSQYELWEYQVRRWGGGVESESTSIPDSDDESINVGNGGGLILDLRNLNNEYDEDDSVQIAVDNDGGEELLRIEAYINDTYLGYDDDAPFYVRFTPENVEGVGENNILRVVGTSDDGEATVTGSFEVDD